MGVSSFRLSCQCECGAVGERDGCMDRIPSDLGNHMGSREREVRETGHVCQGREGGGEGGGGGVRGEALQWGGEKSFVCTGLCCQHKCGFGGSCRPPFLI